MGTPAHLQVTERLLGHLENGSTDIVAEGELRVPVRGYYDDDVAAAERAHLLAQPVVVGHESELPEPGSFTTVDVIGVAVLVVRQPDGSLRGFRNVCRHRGGRVEQEASGTKRVFTCRYHGWAYDTDGGLRNVPYAEYFPSVDTACTGLEPVAVAARHGLVWARVAGEGSLALDLDIEAHLGPEFDAELAKLAIDDCELYVERIVRQPINWKLVMEGAMDVLHLKFLHPTTVGRLIQTNTHVWDRFGDHGRLSMARRKMDKVRTEVTEIENLRPYVISSHFVYPAVMINVQPRSYEIWTVLPDQRDPEACTIAIRVVVAKAATAEEREEVDRTWSVLLDAAEQDDWPMEVSIQQNVRHAPTDTFLCGTSEQPLQHFHRRLADHLTAPH